MEEQMDSVESSAPIKPRSGMTFLLSKSPELQDLLMKPALNKNAIVNDTKLRRLFLQATSQQWFAPDKIHFETPIQMDEDERRAWSKLNLVFYTLEKMGLNVIANMMPKAASKLKSDEVANYLSVQCSDEARHVFAVESYLKKLGAPPQYERKYHVLGQIASLGFYRVENWLFSTLFSENFASCFLRYAKAAKIDPVGAEMCRNLLVDESRHLHFLHIVLPDIMDRLSLFGRSYVKLSQSFIMQLTNTWAKSVDKEACSVGIDRAALLEEVFANVEKAYEGFGVTRDFLRFPKVSARSH